MKVFTTGQVAKICKVAPRTVSKWFDSGRLKGYRIPGSQDRRIPREYLIRFLKEHGMPLGDLEDEAMAKILIVAQDQVLIENLKRELPPERSFKVAVAASGFEAGIQAESFHPDCIITDFSIGKEQDDASNFKSDSTDKTCGHKNHKQSEVFKISDSTKNKFLIKLYKLFKNTKLGKLKVKINTFDIMTI